MENNMTTITEPAVVHPMTSYKEMVRTCSLSLAKIENLYVSNNFYYARY
jgi:hypothetical protein